MLHVTTGYDVGGARFVEFSSRKIRPVSTGFILPSQNPDPPRLKHPGISFEDFNHWNRRPNNPTAIQRSKIAAIE
jgi:hypothetical protein